MPKPNPLSQALSRPVAASPVASTTAATASRPIRTPPRKPASKVRQGTVLVAGHFSPQVQIALKVIAAEERTTVQALLAEGINTILAKRGKPEIAEFSAA